MLPERHISVILGGNNEQDISILNWSRGTGKNGKNVPEMGKRGLGG